jgi:hypothetical protein
MLFIKVINVAIRLINSFLKGIFIIIAARYLNVEDIGLLSIILGYLTIFMFFVGLEFWYFSNREISERIAINRDFNQIILNQFFLYLIIYLLLSPILLFWFEVKYSLGIQFLVILVSNHISQELSRIAIHLNRQLLSSFFAFFTQSFWILPILVLWLFKISPSLNTIFNIYMTLSIITILLNLLIFMRIVKLKVNLIFEPKTWIDFKFIKKGLRFSFLFYLSTISYKVSELLGRFMLEKMGHIDKSGVFSFYQNISSIGVLLIYTGIISFYLPSLLNNLSNKEIYNRLMIKFRRDVVLASFLVLILTTVSGFTIFKYFLREDIYIYNFKYFILVNLSYLFINLSSSVSYIAYCEKKDKVNILSNIISFILSAFIYPIFIFLIKDDIMLSVTLAFTFWALLSLFLKTYFFYNKGLKGFFKKL